MKKISLRLFEEVLYREGKIKQGETEVILTASGYYQVKKPSGMRLFSDIRDAWRSI
jgi:hypothetical protein